MKALQDKKGDEYVNTLKQQFEEHKERFDEIKENLIEDYEKVIAELRQKSNNLENENRRLKSIQGALIKKLDTMESLFAK